MRLTKKRIITTISAAVFVIISGVSLWAWKAEEFLQPSYFSRQVGTSQVSCVGSAEWCEVLDYEITNLEKIAKILASQETDTAAFDITAPGNSRVVTWALYDTSESRRRQLFATFLDTSDLPNMTKQEITKFALGKR